MDNNQAKGSLFMPPGDTQKIIRKVKADLSTSNSNPIPLNGAVSESDTILNVDVFNGDSDDTLLPADVMIVTTVDGNVHGVSRSTGELKWTMEGGGREPLVRSYSNRRAEDFMKDDTDDSELNDEQKRLRQLRQDRQSLDKISYIVEPTGNGNLYVFTPDLGVQRLSHNIKQIVQKTPFSTDTDCRQFYTGSKTTILFAIDGNTGRILRIFDRDLKCPNPFFDDWEDTCTDTDAELPKSAIIMGRTDYTVNIFDESRRKMWNITYNEYGPDSMNFGIESSYTRPIDDTYFVFNHEGIIAAGKFSQEGFTRLWEQKLPSPIVGIFELLHSTNTEKLTIVKHPPPPNSIVLTDETQKLSQNGLSSVYLGCVNGNLFAMSQENFPLSVHAEAPKPYDEPCTPASNHYPDCLVGSHRLSNHVDNGKSYPGIDAPDNSIESSPLPIVTLTDHQDTSNLLLPRAPGLPASSRGHSPLITLAVFLILALLVYWRKKVNWWKKASEVKKIKLVVGRSRSISRNGSGDRLLTDTTQTLIDAEDNRKGPIEVKDIMTFKGQREREAVVDEKSKLVEAYGDVESTPKPGRRKRRGRGGKKKTNAEGEDKEENEEEYHHKNNHADRQPLSSLSAGTASILNSTNPLRMGSLEVSDTVLGHGSHGTVVYRGRFEGRDVAVKRLLMEFYEVAHHEVTLLQQSDEHPNVVRYYCKQQCDKFLYIALELCPASLSDIVEKPSTPDLKDLVDALDVKRALWQIMQGIRFLHQMKIVHRDLKPQNILVTKRNIGGTHMLISDFGLCKRLDADQSSFNNTIVNGAGTVGWRAPELLTGEVNATSTAMDSGSHSNMSGNGSASSANGTSSRRVTRSIDIFSAGCVFYYLLSGGEHPFGDKYSREVNILQGRFNLSSLDGLGEEGTEAQDLISRMIAKDPCMRPVAHEVLVHPYFWTAAQRLSFLQDASDRFEIEVRDPPSPLLQDLEQDSEDIIGSDWHKRIDRMVTDNLGKYRKYDGKLIRDLLRALRNKKHHYQDLPEHVKRGLGSVPDGFLSYFTRRFPRLLLHVYYVIAENEVRHESQFKAYFSV